jgi:hypothetical protein
MMDITAHIGGDGLIGGKMGRWGSCTARGRRILTFLLEMAQAIGELRLHAHGGEAYT